MILWFLATALALPPGATVRSTPEPRLHQVEGEIVAAGALDDGRVLVLTRRDGGWVAQVWSDGRVRPVRGPDDGPAPGSPVWVGGDGVRWEDGAWTLEDHRLVPSTGAGLPPGVVLDGDRAAAGQRSASLPACEGPGHAASGADGLLVGRACGDAVRVRVAGDDGPDDRAWDVADLRGQPDALRLAHGADGTRWAVVTAVEPRPVASLVGWSDGDLAPVSWSRVALPLGPAADWPRVSPDEARTAPVRMHVGLPPDFRLEGAAVARDAVILVGPWGAGQGIVAVPRPPR